jgi:uncharacterized protein DUF4419
MAILQDCFLYSLLSHCALAVIVIPSTLTAPKAFENTTNSVSSAHELRWPELPPPKKGDIPQVRILRSSISIGTELINTGTVYPSDDGFVRGVIEAAAQRQHLVIRPEDVWFTVLTQLSFFMTNHRNNTGIAEKFNYKQNFDLWFWVALMETKDVMRWIGNMMKGRDKTDWLLDWVRPNFTTSTLDDVITATLLISGEVNPVGKKYSAALCSGIPSITLLGTQTDWDQLLLKLNRLPQFGAEAAAYSKILRPVLLRFVRTFNDPTHPDIRRFWDNIVAGEKPGNAMGDKTNAIEDRRRATDDGGSAKMDKLNQTECSGESAITGWISGFHYWDSSGKSLFPYEEVRLPGAEKGQRSVSLDGVVYPRRELHELPISFVSLRARTSSDSPSCAPTDLRAGMVGTRVQKGMPSGYALAMQKINDPRSFTWLRPVAENQHSMLHSVSAWIWSMNYTKPDDWRDWVGVKC